MPLFARVCVFAEMQREHQRREHRLQEAHCCALSTMEEARQHQIRVRHTGRMEACMCVFSSLGFNIMSLPVMLSDITASCKEMNRFKA